MFSRLAVSFAKEVPKGVVNQFVEEGGVVSPKSGLRIVCSSEDANDISIHFIEDSLKVGDALNIEEYRLAKFKVGGVFLGTKMYFAEKIGLQHLVEECKLQGALVVENSEEADVIITSFNEKQLDGFLVSPFWAYRILRTGHLCGPIRPIDRPCPVEAVPGSDAMIISCTGFQDEHERAEIEAMVKLMGAHYTPFLTPSNTVLISKSGVESDKMRRAREWRIRIVSMDWLDESFREWKWV